MNRTHGGSWGWGNGAGTEVAVVESGVMERTGLRLGNSHGTEW